MLEDVGPGTDVLADGCDFSPHSEQEVPGLLAGGAPDEKSAVTLLCTLLRPPPSAAGFRLPTARGAIFSARVTPTAAHRAAGSASVFQAFFAQCVGLDNASCSVFRFTDLFFCGV